MLAPEGKGRHPPCSGSGAGRATTARILSAGGGGASGRDGARAPVSVQVRVLDGDADRELLVPCIAARSNVLLLNETVPVHGIELAAGVLIGLGHGEGEEMDLGGSEGDEESG